MEYKNRLSNEMIDTLKPFLFCQNLSIVAKVMLLLSETSVVFKTFNKYTDEELNDIDPQDIGEEYFDYLLRVNPTFDVEKTTVEWMADKQHFALLAPLQR